jgi:ribosomal RNA assembly protein
MIKRELAKDPKLADQDWSRFLPKFGKRKAAKRTTIGTGANAIEAGPSTSSSAPAPTPFPPVVAPPKKEKKVYTPFPPAQTPRKIDLEMQSGEYFLKPYEKRKKKLEERQEKADVVKAERTKQRLEAFVPPNESQPTSESSKEERKAERKRKREEAAGAPDAEAKLTERKKKSKKAVAFAADD